MAKKEIFIRTAAFLTVFALVAAIAWGVREHCRAEENEALADEFVTAFTSSCARCGEELVEVTREMSLGLEKLRVSGSTARRVLALEDIVRASGEAIGLMTRLPSSQIDVMELETFLAQTGEYARTLSARLIAGGDSEDRDEEQLEAMLAACGALADRASEMLANGELPTGTEDFDYYEATPKEVLNYPEVPKLVYDGELSSDRENAPAIDLGEAVSENEARKTAEAVTGKSMELTGKTEGRLPAFIFEGGGTEALVTISGGRLLSFMTEPQIDSQDSNRSAGRDELTARAQEFLNKVGISEMELVYSEYGDGYACLTFVSREGGILILSDSVKLWLDSAGNITGLDAREYLTHHAERDIPRPVITREEAMASISDRLSVRKVRLALLPLSPSREALCYEIRAACGEGEYLVYINALSGDEEMILKVVSDDDGIRTE